MWRVACRRLHRVRTVGCGALPQYQQLAGCSIWDARGARTLSNAIRRVGTLGRSLVLPHVAGCNESVQADNWMRGGGVESLGRGCSAHAPIAQPLAFVNAEKSD